MEISNWKNLFFVGNFDPRATVDLESLSRSRVVILRKNVGLLLEFA